MGNIFIYDKEFALECGEILPSLKVAKFGACLRVFWLLGSDAFVGEVGLTGEIRRVNRIEQRVAEAEKLGFKRIFISKNNLKGWKPSTNIQVIGVSTLKEALYLALG